MHAAATGDARATQDERTQTASASSAASRAPLSTSASPTSSLRAAASRARRYVAAGILANERLTLETFDGFDLSDTLAALAVDASKLPKGVDASRRERHLSPDAFRAAFGVGATAFGAWPKWRQALAKRKVGLY